MRTWTLTLTLHQFPSSSSEDKPTVFTTTASVCVCVCVWKESVLVDSALLWNHREQSFSLLLSIKLLHHDVPHISSLTAIVKQSETPEDGWRGDRSYSSSETHLIAASQHLYSALTVTDLTGNHRNSARLFSWTKRSRPQLSHSSILVVSISFKPSVPICNPFSLSSSTAFACRGD